MRFWGLLAFRTRRASWAVRRSSSIVEAWEKKAVWGVMMMLGAVSAGWSSGGGAGSTTSRPAPARWPEWRASASACSWMIPAAGAVDDDSTGHHHCEFVGADHAFGFGG